MAYRSGPSLGGAGSRTSVALLLAIVVLLAVRSGFMEFGQKLGDNVKKQLETTEKKREPSPSDEPTIGEGILFDYGKPNTEPQEDLIRMAHTLSNFALLVKGDNPLPLGSNEEIAAALRGKNRAQLRFLPDDHPVFNDKGQIVDRWGTPLFFHAESRDRLDIRSAGPDKTLWTDDDLHRKHDGRFLRGDQLNPPSLSGQGALKK